VLISASPNKQWSDFFARSGKKVEKNASLDQAQIRPFRGSHPRTSRRALASSLPQIP
jgi:hypothetical protein